MPNLDHSTYLSPFSWRYGTSAMRRIWSEENKRLLWRKIWVSLAKAQKKYKLVSQSEIEDLVKYQNDIDIESALEIEKEVYHDLMSEVKVYASQAKIGGGKIHLGATSMDIEDNTDIIRILESIKIIEKSLTEILQEFISKIENYRKFTCMGYTHLQPAEPTTIGYRFAFYAQDLLMDYELLQFVKNHIKGKGMKGAVGTAASYQQLAGEAGSLEIDKSVMKSLGLDSVIVSSQTAPRKIEFLVASLLSSIAQSLHKFCFDIRIMQSPNFGELTEPSGAKDIGSSAMPFKKNPQRSEQVCSLARFVMSQVDVLSQNASNMLLERTLDDSANRRVVLPEIFLATDQILLVGTKIIKGLIVNEQQVKNNLARYAPFSGSESIMMESVKKGANRQEMHEVLRAISMKAWGGVAQGNPNPMMELLSKSAEIMKYINQKDLKKLMDVQNHVGTAALKSELLVKKIKEVIG